MRLFTDLLRDVEGGELVDEITNEIDAIVRAVLDTRKKGSLTIKLEPACSAIARRRASTKPFARRHDP